MGFDDLNDAISEQDANEEESADDSSGSDETQAKRMTETTSDTPKSTETTDDWKRQPAFPYDDASQEAIYPRSSTWDEFEDVLDFEVKRELRDAGIRDIPKREYHDALLKLATEEPERLAKLVLEARQS
ncbi:hypothetical protein [Haloarcula nitratireducens]|uniref:Uncharacterized protein n=1 Tax=Haloarcula nitratireducens TaxID=2487749 RepID=A0AAW4PHC9_9EURY|nr:hypothetical protein [Halomicroarcula nitratireducens]MBX0297435.1 hypothetical protein [Halomicroarcula nitratireducens]